MMKNIFKLCMLFFSIHTAYAQNLITNGSFEQTTNWNNLAGDGGSAVYSYSTTDAFEGTKSLKADVTTLGANTWSIQTIHSGWTAVPGTPYTVTFYAKAATIPTTLRSVIHDPSYAYYVQNDYNLTTTWQKYEWTITPAKADLQLKFNYLTAGASYYIDDVQIVDPSSTGSLTLTIDKNIAFQQMTGFGAGLTWYCDRIMSSPKKSEITELLFSDLGTDIIRFKNWYYPAGYPAVKSPATMATDWYKPHFTATNELQAIAKQQNANIDILLSSWGPPAALKSNNSENEGTLKKDANNEFVYAQFGQYWTDILNNISFTPEYISIQNEPGFETTDWASCAFRPIETSTIAGYDKAFDAVYNQIKNRAVVPKMIGPEIENIGGALWDQSLNTFREFSLPIKNKPGLSAYAYHLYNYFGNPGSISPAPLNMIKNEFNNAPNFMTEFSSSNFDWLQTADIIQESLLQANASAYVYWEMVWGEDNTQAIITIDPSGNYTIGNHYHTLKHFSKFIDKGYTRIALTGNNALTKSSAFINPAGTQITIVSVNNSNTSQDINLIPGGQLSGIFAFQSVAGNFYQTITVDAAQPITLPAKSITTFVLSLTNSCPVATISNETSASLCPGGSVALTANSGASYKWFNGTTQVGTTQSYTASTAGNYTVEVTDAASCKSTSSAKVVTVLDPSQCVATSTTDALRESGIIIAPNPSHDVFSLVLTHASDVQVHTIEGKLIDAFTGVNNLTFGATYAKGIYLVKVNNGTKTDVIRVVKQ